LKSIKFKTELCFICDSHYLDSVNRESSVLKFIADHFIKKLLFVSNFFHE